MSTPDGLNPQPEPPGSMALNPQPEPPGATAAGVGGVMKLAAGVAALVLIGGGAYWLWPSSPAVPAGPSSPAVPAGPSSPGVPAAAATTITVTITPKTAQANYDVIVPLAKIKTSHYDEQHGGGLTAPATGHTLVTTMSSGTLTAHCRAAAVIDSTTIITWAQTGKTYRLNQSAPISVPVAGSASIPIIATAGGPAYNAPAGQNWLIGSCTDSSSAAPISGGSSTTQTYVSQTDFDTTAKTESMKIWKSTANSVEAAATAAGNVVVPSHSSFVVTKQLAKPAVGTVTSSFIAAVEDTVSVLTTTTAELLSAALSESAPKDPSKWTLQSVAWNANGSAAEVKGLGDLAPVSVATDKLAAKIQHDHLSCSAVKALMAQDPSVAAFSVSGLPTCTDAPTNTPTVTFVIQKP